MSDELKPCPFCGGEATAWTTEAYSCDSDERVLGCRKCDVYMPYGSVFESDAIPEAYAVAWNTRADLPATNAQALANPMVQAVRNALRECILEMGACRVFVNSRQKTKQPEGADIYEEVLDKARAALAAMEKNDD